MLLRYLIVLLLTLGLVAGQCKEEDQQSRIREEDPLIDPDNPILDSSVNRDDSIIILSTLEGSLIAVSKRTGQIKWRLEDEPVVKLSKQLSKALNPVFLPDPKDGSLYMLGSSGAEALIKLPFTIPELVAASPSQNGDGMLYMGKKLDMWYVIDPITGNKEEVLSFQGLETSCPRNKQNGPSIFIGRTEYSLMLFDSHTKERRWNVTYFDYTSSTLGSQDPQDYDLAHFTTSSSGKVLTLDRHSGDLLWQQDFHSPVVGMYGLIHDVTSVPNVIGLVDVPFTSLAVETLQNLASRLDKSSEQERRITGDTKLFPTLYVGQSAHGLYAIPSLVDEYTSTFTASHTGRLLIEGPAKDAQNKKTLTGQDSTSPNPSNPLNVNIRLPSDMRKEWMEDYKTSGSSLNSPRPPVVLFGHYKVPEYSPSRSSAHLQISDASPDSPDADQEAADTNKNKENETKHADGTTWTTVHVGTATLAVFLSAVLVIYCQRLIKSSDLEPKHFVASHSAIDKPKDGGPYSSHIELPTGHIQVGKIIFHPREVLGKGCEGTFVFRGKYDTRDVAVKRLLPGCFTVADREVDLLRESDAHPNVIRYFCTEQDKQFKYIALEMGVATLQEYVEGRYRGPPITGIDILRHATAGLSHLHSLDIVHRDVKPQNVLISAPNGKGEIRAMISDFGLCKKLKIGRMSFSQRSGVAGTEGWIAPEMMIDEVKRTTCAVDIFSLGLVYFYVLTKGQHPFGDLLRRQANILSGEYDLNAITENVAAYTLIEKMISVDPLERPPARAILIHPIFWCKEKILGFFIDTSDRVEKETSDSAVLQCLERGGADVVRNCWKNHIEPTVMADLRKHRTYQGRSVRDLLRALRNKKNHYREVTEDVRRIMGRSPEEFCDYWTIRFPKLLMHAWYAMHCVKTEHIFERYYDRQYDFIQKPIVWLPSKPKSIFRTIEAGFHMFDPLYPKSMGLQVPSRPFDLVSKGEQNDPTPSVDDDTVKGAAALDDVESSSVAAEPVEEPIPDSWDQRLNDVTEEDQSNATSADAQVPDTKADSSSEGSGDQEDSADANAKPKGANEDDIVLGPGSLWGRPLELKPMEMFRPAVKTNDDVSAPVAAAWKLPSLAQPWKFSEIEHHGRRKKKAKKKKKDDGSEI